MSGIAWSLRVTGRVVVLLGLAIFYGSFAVLTVADAAPPYSLFVAAFVLVAAGCLWLIGVLAWPQANKGGAGFEGVVGILSVLPGALLAMLLAVGRLYATFLLVITFVLTPSSVVLFVLATRAKRQAESWRNTGASQ